MVTFAKKSLKGVNILQYNYLIKMLRNAVRCNLLIIKLL